MGSRGGGKWSRWREAGRGEMGRGIVGGEGGWGDGEGRGMGEVVGDGG